MAFSTGSSHCQRVGCANGGRGNRVKGRSYAIQQIIDQFTHGPDGVTKRQFFGAPKKQAALDIARQRSEEHTSELQSLMRISYAVFCLKKKNNSFCRVSELNRYLTAQHYTLVEYTST